MNTRNALVLKTGEATPNILGVNLFLLAGIVAFRQIVR